MKDKFVDCYHYQDFSPVYAEASREFPANTYGPLTQEEAEKIAEYMLPYFSEIKIVTETVGQAIQRVPEGIL